MRLGELSIGDYVKIQGKYYKVTECKWVIEGPHYYVGLREILSEKEETLLERYSNNHIDNPTYDDIPMHDICGYSGDSGNVNISEIHPILLTRSVLEKVGLTAEKNNDENSLRMSDHKIDGLKSYVITALFSRNNKSQRIPQLRDIPKKIDCCGSEGSFTLSDKTLYLHDLQHALRLCEITKKIAIYKNN